jgi:hypothetical protein
MNLDMPQAEIKNQIESFLKETMHVLGRFHFTIIGVVKKGLNIMIAYTKYQGILRNIIIQFNPHSKLYNRINTK